MIKELKETEVGDKIYIYLIGYRCFDNELSTVTENNGFSVKIRQANGFVREYVGDTQCIFVEGRPKRESGEDISIEEKLGFTTKIKVLTMEVNK